MERSNQIGWAQVRAGVFIFIALAILGSGVLLMGEKTKMFTPKTELRVIMDDVAGLKEGAPVWLAGVDVGVVTAIAFSDPQKTNEVEIRVQIERDALRKINTDSLITIKTRGLMGEKYVDILPSKTYTAAPPKVVRGMSSMKLDDVVQKAGTTFDRINGVIDNVNQGKGTLGKLTTDPELYFNIVKLTNELSALTIAINRGEGTLGKLTRNPEPYNRLISILTRAEQTLKDIQASDGTMNRLIYDRTLYTKLVTLADKSVQAADDVRELNKKLTSRDTTLGMLITDREFYDKGFSMLTRADNSLKALEEVTGRVNRGEGTLGKVVTDKELYEKMNRMVESVDQLMTDIKQNPGRYVKFSLF